MKAIKILFCGMNLAGAIFLAGTVYDLWECDFLVEFFGSDGNFFVALGVLLSSGVVFVFSFAALLTEILDNNWGIFSGDSSDLTGHLGVWEKIITHIIIVLTMSLSFLLAMVLIFETKSVLGGNIWGNIKVNSIILALVSFFVANAFYWRRFLRKE